MRHDPIEHPLGCDCGRCARPVDLRAILLAALGAAIPVYGLVWALWSILPN